MNRKRKRNLQGYLDTNTPSEANDFLDEGMRKHRYGIRPSLKLDVRDFLPSFGHVLEPFDLFREQIEFALFVARLLRDFLELFVACFQMDFEFGI